MSDISISDESGDFSLSDRWFSLSGENFSWFASKTIFYIQYLLDKALLESLKKEKQGNVKYEDMNIFKIDSVKELIETLVLFESEINIIIDENNKEIISENKKNPSREEYIRKIVKLLNLSDEEIKKLDKFIT